MKLYRTDQEISCLLLMTKFRLLLFFLFGSPLVGLGFDTAHADGGVSFSDIAADE